MKGLILAAGLGTRLRPLTDRIPKPLIEVNGKPMLEYVVLKMKDAGIDDIIINTHHLGEKIQQFVYAKNSFGIKIRISHEPTLLDTGGAIVNCKEYLSDKEPFVVYNSDIYSDFPLIDFIANHLKAQNEITLLASRRKTSRYLLFAQNGRMQGWTKADGSETRPHNIVIDGLERKAFGGVHVINSSVLDKLEKYSEGRGKVFSITDFYIDNCMNVDIGFFEPPSDYFWYDIGKLDILEKLKS